MNTWDIDAFLAIVETHNLAKASELLFISQSTISRRLKGLEKELGCELIRRNKGQRSVQLTECGEQFISVAQHWRSIYNETQHFKESTIKMHLDIGCSEWFNCYSLLSFYRMLIAREPDLSIKVISVPSYTTYSMLNESEIDVGFVCDAQVNNGIDTTPVFRDPLVLVCDERSEWVSPNPISPSVLDPAYEIEWNHLPEYRMWHNRWWDPEIAPRVVSDFSMSLCFSFVCNPNFWVIAPMSVAEQYVRDGSGLVIQSLTDKPPDFTCYVVIPYMIRSSRQQGVELFKKCLAEFVEDLGREKPWHIY